MFIFESLGVLKTLDEGTVPTGLKSLSTTKISRNSTLVTSPTNPFWSNGIGGKYVNVYNFTRNIAKGLNMQKRGIM